MQNEINQKGPNEMLESTEDTRTPIERIECIRKMIVDGKKLGFNEELMENLNNKLQYEVLNIIASNCQSTEETMESGIKGKRIKITLPEIGESFKKFEFNSFIADESIEYNEFENNPELEKKSVSIKELIELINKIDEYYNCLGYKTDGKARYDKTTNRIKGGKIAREALSRAMHFPAMLFLKDKNVGGKTNIRAGYYWGIRMQCICNGLYGWPRLK